MLPDYGNLSPASIHGDCEAGIAAAEARIAQVLAVPGPGTFESVMIPFDELSAIIARANALAAFPAQVAPSAAVRKAARKAEERLGQWVAELNDRDDINEKVLAYAGSDEAKTLDPVRSRLLDDQVYSVETSGYGKPQKLRDELRVIRRHLVELEVAFSENIAAAHDPVIARADELDGLPITFMASLAAGDEPGTYELPLTGPTLSTVSDDGRCRALRERLYRAWSTRAMETNIPVIEETLVLRRRLATLLGYPSWAHYRIKRRMAKTPETVAAFYAELLPGLLRLGRAQMDRLADLLEADAGTREVANWDVFFYHARLRERDYGLNAEAVSEYFPLAATLAGFFELTGTLFGLNFTEVSPDGAWHPDVRRYEVRDNPSGELLGVFDTDLFPREGKFTHAASFPLLPAYRLADGSRAQAYSAMVANFPAPVGETPALLTFAQTEILFHEMGHILHGILSQAEFASQAGTNVQRDFVEAPSQIMENFLREPAVLRRFARHYRSGEPIPEALVAGLTAAADIDAAVFDLSQVRLGRYDLAIHGPEPVDIVETHRRLWADTLRAYPEGTFDLASIGHFFEYDAGYYGYLWSEVRGDDMWSRFAQAGVLDPAVGAAYRRAILEPGDSRDPAELLRAFLGREPSAETFLRLRGLA